MIDIQKALEHRVMTAEARVKELEVEVSRLAEENTDLNNAADAAGMTFVVGEFDGVVHLVPLPASKPVGTPNNAGDTEDAAPSVEVTGEETASTSDV